MIQMLSTYIESLRSDERGQGIVEYALIIALVSVVRSSCALELLGTDVARRVFDDIATRSATRSSSRCMHRRPAQPPIAGSRGGGSVFRVEPHLDEQTPQTLRTRRLRLESGAALVEFALVLPIFLVLLLGMFDFGKAFNYWIDGTHLSHEGARYAAVGKNPGPGAHTRRLDQGAGRHRRASRTAATRSRARSRVCVSFPDGTSQVGDPVEVNGRVHLQVPRLHHLDGPVGHEQDRHEQVNDADRAGAHVLRRTARHDA